MAARYLVKPRGSPWSTKSSERSGCVGAFHASAGDPRRHRDHWLEAIDAQLQEVVEPLLALPRELEERPREARHLDGVERGEDPLDHRRAPLRIERHQRLAPLAELRKGYPLTIGANSFVDKPCKVGTLCEVTSGLKSARRWSMEALGAKTNGRCALR